MSNKIEALRKNLDKVDKENFLKIEKEAIQLAFREVFSRLHKNEVMRLAHDFGQLIGVTLFYLKPSGEVIPYQHETDAMIRICTQESNTNKGPSSPLDEAIAYLRLASDSVQKALDSDLIELKKAERIKHNLVEIVLRIRKERGRENE